MENLNNWKMFLSGESVERCSLEVSARNGHNLRAFSLLGIVMMSFAIVFGWIMRHAFTFSTEFLIMWAYFLVMYLVTRFIGAHTRHATAAFYFWITPLMLMGIVIGTFADPQQPSITIMVFLCVLPMFILDKPWKIVLFILMHSVVYTICCYLAKSPELFIADMIDLVLFMVLSVGVNCLILRERIDNVEYAMKMRLMAETDALTELNNRGAGEKRVKLLMEQGKSGMFLLLDFDNFKEINDNYGHVNGDKALKAVAACLRESFRDNDVVMRFGGDEFGVFAQGIKNRRTGEMCINRMMRKIHDLFVPDMPDYHFSVSAGITFFNADSQKNFETVYRESDEALYLAKRQGKNSCSFYGEK